MSTQITGTIIGGRLELDEPIALPDQSRVNVVISPRSEECAPRIEAFERWRKHIQEHPVDSGGMRFTREELHERMP